MTKPESMGSETMVKPPDPAPEFAPAVPSEIASAPGSPMPASSRAQRTARGRGEPKFAAAASRTPRQAGTSPKSVAPALSSEGPVELRTAPASGRAAQPEGPSNEQKQTSPLAETHRAWTPLSIGEEGPGCDASPETEELPHVNNSRLSGLRRMLIALGRRSLMEEGFDEGGLDLDPQFEGATARSAHSEPPEEAADEIAAAHSAAGVNARPEFLPPRPVADLEKEKEPIRSTAPVPLRDHRETQDEIQTLPSWRGQYRKKRYPPV